MNLNKLYIIKIGGNVIDNEELLLKFLDDFAKINYPKILIHGGGKMATQIGNRMGIVSKYYEGRRITDKETIELVTMVYGGLVNKIIVAHLQSIGSNAIGLTGADANLIPAQKRSPTPIDFGYVGDVNHEKINITFIQSLIQQNLQLILSPLTHDGCGFMLNTNADTIASCVAVAMAKLYDVSLMYCFEKKGILSDINNEYSVISNLDFNKYQNLLSEKKIFDGIIPKINNAFDAIKLGIKEVWIGDALELKDKIKNKIVGTTIANKNLVTNGI